MLYNGIRHRVRKDAGVFFCEMRINSLEAFFNFFGLLLFCDIMITNFNRCFEVR